MKKVGKIVKLHILPCLVCALLLLSPLSVAHAAVWEGIVTLRVDYWGHETGNHFQMNQQLASIPISSNMIIYGPKDIQTANGLYFKEDQQTWTKPVDVYMSGYLAASANAIASDKITMYGDPYDRSNYEVTYRGTHGGDGLVVGDTLVELGSFTPNESRPHGEGITIRAGWAADEVNPISDLTIRPIVECGWKCSGSPSYSSEWIITSLRLISSDTTAELDELSNVADQIIAGNEILEAMKGDVVALLQQIYATTGDINIAAERTNELLRTLIDCVDELEGQFADFYADFRQLLYALQYNHGYMIELMETGFYDIKVILRELVDLIEGDGMAWAESDTAVDKGEVVQDALNELQKPDYEDFDFNTEGYVDQFDGGSGESSSAMSRFLGVMFDNSMITTMLMVSLSFAMVAYVLYGKR